ncbi:MAG: dCMP deaminase family protein [Firmicutes bacterium]|nr:dCMP deaminase family protein [Bacillota bacterium]
MEIAHLVAKRSTCLRRQVGAVLIRNRHILSTGYNGAPSGLEHCLDIGCLRQELGIPSGQQQEICRGIHAEQNAIIQAALHGVSTEGATLYCTTQPCSQCAKMLINAGVKQIIYEGDYPDELARQLLEEAQLTVRRWGCIDSKADRG